jgi:predicted RNA-binding protein YlqC (UPF0109 family)
VVQEFVLSYARMIASHPEALSIVVEPMDEYGDEITLYADPTDVGKLIGKEGRMINAIKTIISGCKAKGGKSYRVNVKAAA